MLQAAQDKNNTLNWAGAFIVLATIAVFAFTGQYLVLLAPVGVLVLSLIMLNWKTAWWIFLFSIPASIQISFLHDTLSTSVPDEPMMWLFLFTFIIIYAARPSILPEWWWRSPIVLVVVLQFLWLIVAVCFSQEPFISLKFLLAKCWFLVSYFLLPLFIFRTKKDFKRAFLLFLVPLLITMIIIMIRHAQRHFSFLLINRSISIIYFNRVDYAAVMSMFFPLLLVAYHLMKGMALWKRWAMRLIILFFLPAVYFTYARGAIIAIIFALVIGVIIRKKLVQWVMPAVFVLMTVGVTYMVRHNKYIDFRPDYEHTFTHLTFADHLVATFRGTDMSSMERLYRWIAGVRMSTDQPVTGYGPNSFWYFYKPYAVTSFRTYVSRNPERSTTHNYFLFMLVEQGWPAMLLYALLLQVFFVQAQRTYHRFKDRFYRSVTIGVAMLFAAGFINDFFSELIETHKVGALYYIALALLIILTKKSKDEEKTGVVE